MTPRHAIVPVELDAALLKAALENSLRIMKRDGSAELMPDEPGPRPSEVITSAWQAMLAASPSSGRVSAADLERAAVAIGGAPFPSSRSLAKARAVIASLGLAVEGDPASAGAGKLKGTRGCM